MRLAAGFAAALALALAACAPSKAAPDPPAPVDVTVKPVAQWLAGSEPVVPVPGTFTYAGGLELSAPKAAHFGGLSDIDVQPDGRFVAVEDEGELVWGRIVTDAKGRLVGVRDVTKAKLGNLEGGVVSGGKADSDSEGLARWPNGDLMVSFEGRHRIWLYPAAGGPPHAVPFPDAPFPFNDGMEALALDPESGANAYLVGREDTRDTWICRLAEACVPYLQAGKGEYGKLVSARALPGGRWAFLFRDFNVGGITSRLAITDRKGVELDLLTIARPANVDNTEGVSALPRPDGSIRFYLISDDNFAANQRTLLLAYDWRPPKLAGKGATR